MVSLREGSEATDVAISIESWCTLHDFEKLFITESALGSPRLRSGPGLITTPLRGYSIHSLILVKKRLIQNAKALVGAPARTNLDPGELALSLERE